VHTPAARRRRPASKPTSFVCGEDRTDTRTIVIPTTLIARGSGRDALSNLTGFCRRLIEWGQLAT
jgi:hypothetical protein